MMMDQGAQPHGPRKLFREEAQTGAVACPACGGPITLHGFGAIERVNCPYCGSECTPQESGELQLLQQAMRQRRQSALPLHQRCTFDGIEYRGDSQAAVEELAAHAGVPVFNGLTNDWHPNQMLADAAVAYALA